jgi:hypothetical protein
VDGYIRVFIRRGSAVSTASSSSVTLARSRVVAWTFFGGAIISTALAGMDFLLWCNYFDCASRVDYLGWRNYFDCARRWTVLDGVIISTAPAGMDFL